MKLIHTSGKELQIENADIIGRKEGKHISFFKKFDSVSGIHGTFYNKNKTWFYKDLGSTNGSSLNGNKIVPYKGIKISNGDKIKISEELFTVSIDSSESLQFPQTNLEKSNKSSNQDSTIVNTTNTQQKTELISSFYKGKKKFLENKNFVKFYPAIIFFIVVLTGIAGIMLISKGSWFKSKKSAELNEILNKSSFPKKEDNVSSSIIDNNQSIQLVESSSKELKSKDHNFNVNNLIDGDLSTCWKESEPGAGEGQWLEFYFKNKVNIDKIRIANGFQKDELFTQNNRLKSIYICVNSYETCKKFSLKDTKGWEEFELYEQNVNRLKLIIDSVYNGTKWDDTAIAEINFIAGDKVSMPKKLSSSQKGKKEVGDKNDQVYDKIKEDAKKLKKALKSYKKKFKSYPSQKQGLLALVEKPKKAAPDNWEPVLEDKSVLSDPWGNSYKLKLEKKKKPIILTYGRDKKKGGKGLDADFNILNKKDYPD